MGVRLLRMSRLIRRVKISRDVMWHMKVLSEALCGIGGFSARYEVSQY